MSVDEISRKIERLTIILIARATHKQTNEEEFVTLRKELISDRRVKDILPSFMHTCSNFDEFWIFIKAKFDRYFERSEYINAEFNKTIEKLESQTTVPSDAPTTTTLTEVDSNYINDVWEKALKRRTSDPDGAITSARTLLESTCKYILDKLGEAYEDKWDLPKLYSAVAKKLELAPRQQTNRSMTRMLGGCTTAIHELGS